MPMQCLICRHGTKVTNSRSAERGKAIKRRRLCVSCGRRFTTYERIELVGCDVLKRDGSREPYQQEKVEAGIRKALEKRPISESQLQKLVAAVETDIFQLELNPVPTERIGHIVLSHLRQVDKVAYLRFASVYRNFRSTRAFAREIKKLEGVASTKQR